MSLPEPAAKKKRIVIIGGGFAGTKLAQRLDSNLFQLVLLDKNNYRQFQPLIYQVASSGLEPSAISFPFRRAFRKKKDFHFRMAEVIRIIPEENRLICNIGSIDYDYLVIAGGTDTNYFGIENIKKNAMPMKTVSEALGLRNTILTHFEKALLAETDEDRQTLLNIVVVGGGPTGVEISGALAEMKRYILPKDYPEIDFELMQIYLFEGADKLLGSMSQESSDKSSDFLRQLGVKIYLNSLVKDYVDDKVILADGKEIRTKTLIWSGGVIANAPEGINPETLARGKRIKVNSFNRVEIYDNIFAVGDVCFQTEENYPDGHPQVAQVAIQQAKLLAENFPKIVKGEKPTPFSYKDKGSMATIGRNKAVVDLKNFKIQGFFAWYIWMFVHLLFIMGVKNRAFIFLDWIWSYVTYDQPLRLIIKQSGS
ncbi:MAG: NAD(P)/FAD-dependent oxidoreductase [Candidatus Azobacteroides sp.]|nr:NAD(P)/FAD-dependent oxidoreductase [Candidatus Azobacteroides sp.]